MDIKKEYSPQAAQKNMAHALTLTQRSDLRLSGVCDVGNYCTEKVELKTSMGSMLIKGKNLTINSLCTDTGELNITGDINSMEYMSKKEGGFFARLFK